MKVKIAKVGNSLSLRIPRRVASEIHVVAGSFADLTVKNDSLIVTPEKHSYDLKDLLKGITDDNLHSEIDTGRAMGSEF